MQGPSPDQTAMQNCCFYENRFYYQFLQNILRSRITCRGLDIVILQLQLDTNYLALINVACLHRNAAIYFGSLVHVEVLATCLSDSCKSFMVCKHKPCLCC